MLQVSIMMVMLVSVAQGPEIQSWLSPGTISLVEFLNAQQSRAEHYYMAQELRDSRPAEPLWLLDFHNPWFFMAHRVTPSLLLEKMSMAVRKHRDIILHQVCFQKKRKNNGLFSFFSN